MFLNQFKNQQKELFKFIQQHKVERDFRNLKLNSINTEIFMEDIGKLKFNGRENIKR